MHLTANRLAAMVAHSASLDKAGQTRVFRVIRNLVDKDVIPTQVDELDARGSRLMDEAAAALALLLLPLADLAIDVRGLRDAAADLRALDLLDGKSHIAHALDAARAGKDVRLIIRLRWTNGTAAIQRRATLRIEGDGPEGEVTDFQAADAVSRGPALATVEIPASGLLRLLG